MKVEAKFIRIESDVNGLILADYIDNAQIWTGNTVKADDSLNTVDTVNLPELPASGWVEKGLYNYNGQAVYAHTPHNRMHFAPKETPTLFSVFRNNADELGWIEGEKVELGWKRWYNEKQYICLLAHLTNSGWTPDKTIAILWNEVQQQGEKPPQWVTGDWEKYTMGYQVFDSGKVWEVIGLSHTWIQPALTGNGAISWKFVKEWVE